MNLNELVNKYIKKGYSKVDAFAKVSQDIVLLKISKSSFCRNITIKGGVVIHSISKDKRRATRDIDLDFIKYSLNDTSIMFFIDTLNKLDDGVKIEIIGSIKNLHHQDYNGKRVNIIIKDSYGFSIVSKMDIGVQKLFNIKQEEYSFDLELLENEVSLLINSVEQIFVEKLKSILKFGISSTRFKDIFDFYYFIYEKKINKQKLLKYINILIIEDNSVKENDFVSIYNRLFNILNDKRYLKKLNNSDNNWLDIPIDEVKEYILNFFKELILVK